MSYEKRAPKIRVSKEFADCLEVLKKETGLKKVQITKKLAKELKLKPIKRFKFDFKV